MSVLPPLIDEPLADEVEIHNALVNWGRWCRDRWRPGTANSAEGNYVPPKGNIYNPPEPRVAINTVSAVEVNAGLLAIATIYRTALRLRYFEKAPDLSIKRAVGVKRREYGTFMRNARLALVEVLQRRGSALIVRA